MANLMAPLGELKLTLQIKRADTGKVETVEMVGKVTDDEAAELLSGLESIEGPFTTTKSE